jgi:hypothetical protein
MPPLPLQVVYSTGEFLTVFDAEISKAGLLVRGAALSSAQAMAECALSVQIAGGETVVVVARVAAVVPGVGVAVMFEGVPQPLAELAQRLRSPQAAPEEDAPAAGPVSERLKAMTVSQKMALALSGNREERFALLRDPVKTLHVFVLKNPRIGLDEVAWAAKQPTLSPEALKLISEHREWSGNATVCIALVRNPKTPLPLAVRLLDRIPMSEVRAIAKGGAREQIVHAARKKVNG